MCDNYKIEESRKMNTLLVIDYNNLLFRSLSRLSHLSFNGITTGGIFGFITTTVKYLRAFSPRHVIVCYDSKPYSRTFLFPLYKGDRKSDPLITPHLNDTKKHVNRFLEILNIPCWKEEGLESDDLIWNLVKHYTSKFDKLYILSNDSDLVQLFKFQNVVLCKSKLLYTLHDFERDFTGIGIDDWIKVSSLTGTHNNIPGIQGIGIKRALDIVKENRWDDVYLQNKEVLDLYIRLITLPFTEILPLQLVNHTYNEKEMYTLFDSLGINLTTSIRLSFEKLASY